MENNPVYIKFNNYRKDDFRVRTEIKKEKKKFVVNKIGENNKSQDFLKNIYNNYLQLSEKDLPFHLNKASLGKKKNCISFEHLKGSSLLHILEKAIAANSTEDYIEVLKKVESIIEQLPSKNTSLDNKFQEIFGGKQMEKKYDCIFPGILDLNLDNLLVDDDNTIHLIDYEWVFDFHIPKRYVFYRTIFNSFIQLSDIPKESINLEKIEKIFNFSNSEIQQYLLWEEHFQKYVNKNSDNIKPLKKDRKNILNSSLYKKDWVLSSNEIEQKMQAFTSEIEEKENQILEKENTIQEKENTIQEKENTIQEKENTIQEKEKDIVGLKENINTINNELHEFRSFKAGLIWRSLNQYRRIKNKLKISTLTKGLLSLIKAIPLRTKRFFISRSDKVTIVIPVWDRTEELRESIESILNQSYENIELILVTDGSPKETLNVIREYENHPKVKIFYYYDNSGNAVRGRNKGIREATGKYLAFQDSDDIADKDRIKISLKYIKKYRADGVYGGWRAKLDGSRKDTGLEDNQEIFSPECTFEMMKETCVPCQSTVMIKTEALRKLGGLKPSMKYREDHELWIRFMYNGYKFKSIPEILTNLRLHKGNAELLFKENDSIWKKLMMNEYKENALFKEKIAYIIPSTGVGGGIGVIVEHANRLIERGYDVLLISESGETELSWISCSAQIIPLNTEYKYYFRNIDLLIATGWSTVQYLDRIESKRKSYFIQSDERRFFEEKDKEYVQSVHNTYKTEYEFFTMAKWIQKWLKEEFNKDAYYVPNGIDFDSYSGKEPLEKRPEQFRVLLEGPISVWFKGMEDAYHSVKDLPCEKWVVSGAGSLPSNWEVDKFFENIPQAEMPKIYSSCDFLLKMSKVESFCLPALEAMSCGCIPIVTKFSGHGEFMKNNYNTKKINIGDTKQAKETIIDLINNQDLRESLIKNGVKTAKKWNWERSIDMLERVIKQEKIKKYYNSKTEKYSYKKYKEKYLKNYNS